MRRRHKVINYGEAKEQIPEKNLLRAILGRAVEDITGVHVWDVCYKTKEERRMATLRNIDYALDFITHEGEEPFSFKWICKELDLNHKLVKEALSKRLNEKLPPRT